jgi:hypothetical protein
MFRNVIPRAKAAPLTALLLFFVAVAPSSSENRGPLPVFLRQSAPRSREADDIARFLAGRPGTAGSRFTELEAEPAWQMHRQELDRTWHRVESASVPAMREFQQRELTGAPLENGIVFYPFGGPDALTVTILFPHSPVYILVGLEPAGTLPTVEQLAGQDLDVYLRQIRDSVSSELRRSFFITREMDRDFRGQIADGLFTPILHLLARTNHTILGYRYVRLDDAGQVAERAAGPIPPGSRPANAGVEVEFRTDEDQSVHKLFYFRVNLADAKLKQNTAFLTFLSSLKGMTTFLKATYYMPHRKEFSMIRGLILTGSAAVLQDDSGIPYQYFDASQWHIQLYGDYERPYGNSFRWMDQPDLRKAYSEPGTRPLNFRMGYGYSRVPSNLLLARKTVSSARR